MNEALQLKARGLAGRVLAVDIIHPETREVLVHAGTMLTECIVISLAEGFGVDEFTSVDHA